jgi:hypothetical protein
MKEKICSKCKNVLDIINFCKDKKSKDGLQSQCKSCKKTQIKEYYKNNPDKKWGRSKEQNRFRYHKNKVNYNFSRRMRKSLNGLKGGKSWELLTDYTLEDLISHLEVKFVEGMSWDNYGEWHIDHIIPINFFNITSVECEDFKKCWSLDNLQPLWGDENISKGTKII